MNTVFKDPPKRKKPRLRLHYSSKKLAENSVKKLRRQTNKQYQRQAATTLYYRAKLHKYQTKGMKNAAKVYRKFLQTLKNKKNI
jgi:hypothetical protein